MSPEFGHIIGQYEIHSCFTIKAIYMTVGG